MDLDKIKDFLPVKALNNLLEPSTYAIGQTLGALLYSVFQVPIKYGIIKRAEFDKLAEEVSQKAKEIPEENRDDSKAGLMLKALEESKYQLNQEELRKMFAQLVASTLDNRKNQLISPRFATVLSQLSGDDARFLKFLATDKSGQLVYGYLIQRKEKYGKYKDLSRHMYNGPSINQYSVLPQSSVDVLQSLGVVVASEATYPSNPKLDQEYNRIEVAEKNLCQADSIQDQIIEFQHGHVTLTTFGYSFAQCIL